LILGYQAFDKDIHIAGVILNNLGGSRHEAKLRAVIEHYTDTAVIGAIQNDERLTIVERHLGLMPSNESDAAMTRISAISHAIESQVDLDRLLTLTAKEPLIAPARASVTSFSGLEKISIGIARDSAFGFYYADDLDALTAAGAQLVPFDTINDPHLPEVDALFIGGGFPEIFAKELEANESLRNEIRHAIEAGMPVYAECGGLMYLARSIVWNGRSASMVGAIPGDAVMHDRPVGRGYVHLRETAAHPWARADAPIEIRGHEFHYSSLENLTPGLEFAYRVKRGHGVDGSHDGVVHRNLLASYAHQRGVGGNAWPARFVAFVRKVGAERRATPRRVHVDQIAA
jgi:cobyrinic acid a,c-diamide synthase